MKLVIADWLDVAEQKLGLLVITGIKNHWKYHGYSSVFLIRK